MSYSISYKNFSSEQGATPKDVNPKWWAIEGEDSSEKIADSIAVIIQTLKNSQNKLEAQRQASARLYGNIPLYGTLGLSTNRGAATLPVVRDRLTYNVVQSCVDTVTAKIAKNRPKPLFLTNGGDYRLQRKAKKLNQFMEGIFFENKVHTELAPTAFRDCAVLGDGLVHVYDWYGQVKIERVLSSEILVDELEAVYGQPTQMHRVKNVDRLVLAEMFPKYKAKIMRAEEAFFEGMQGPHISDQLTVAESWHLPRSPNARDGKHVIVITGCTLFEEEWTDDCFPFAKLPWCPRLYGYWAQGGAEQIQNIQLEINKLLWVIQRSMHLAGTSKIWLQQGSKVDPSSMNNDLWTIGWYVGNPPLYVTPPIVQPEIYQHLQTLKASAYEQFGISQLSASSKKPDGLDSGKALREFNDIESERYMIIGQNYEKFHLDITKLCISTARRIYKRRGELTSRVPGSKFLDTIDWGDVDMNDDQYVMQIFPISSLPSDPAGRLATIQEYAQAGYIDPRTARRLSDFPDLQQVETLAGAVEERILNILDKIVDDGEFSPPDQFMEPGLARQLALQYYNQYVNQGMEDDKLQMLVDFMNQLDVLTAPAMPAPVDPGMSPQAVPAPPPQSDLLPNAPVPQIAA